MHKQALKVGSIKNLAEKRFKEFIIIHIKLLEL